MTATFLSLFILVSFIVAGHRYSIGAPDFANEDRLFHLTAVGSQNDYQLSILAMSDRLFALRLFARVARKGSFSAAGRELNIPQSTHLGRSRRWSAKSASRCLFGQRAQ